MPFRYQLSMNINSNHLPSSIWSVAQFMKISLGLCELILSHKITKSLYSSSLDDGKLFDGSKKTSPLSVCSVEHEKLCLKLTRAPAIYFSASAFIHGAKKTEKNVCDFSSFRCLCSAVCGIKLDKGRALVSHFSHAPLLMEKSYFANALAQWQTIHSEVELLE